MAPRQSSPLQGVLRHSNSPRGVADLFVRFDEATIKQDLNNSFSWVENKIPVFHPLPPPRGDIRSQLEQVENRLKWLEEQSIRDKEDYRDRLREAKAECREELQKKYAPLIEGTDQEKQQARLVFESNKIIQFIRDDNAKLRREINVYQRQIAQIKHDNAQLEKANQKAQAAYDELNRYVQAQQKASKKLSRNCDIFKSQLRKMKDEYAMRMAYFHSEVAMGSTFEKCLAKVLSNVKIRSKDANLIESVYATAEEGAEKAGEGRDLQLQKSGLTRECPNPRRCSIFDSSGSEGRLSSDSDSDSESDY